MHSTAVAPLLEKSRLSDATAASACANAWSSRPSAASSLTAGPRPRPVPPAAGSVLASSAASMDSRTVRAAAAPSTPCPSKTPTTMAGAVLGPPMKACSRKLSWFCGFQRPLERPPMLTTAMPAQGAGAR